MRIKRKENRGRFAVKNQFNDEYWVNVFVGVEADPTPENPQGEKDGLLLLYTDQGDRVAQLGPNQFTIMSTCLAIPVTSDNPDPLGQIVPSRIQKQYVSQHD